MADAAIVITTRDRADELRGAVRSALEQDADVDVVVVDDGSSDGTSDMLAREFPAVRVVRHETSAGLVVRRNEAARLVDAPIIVSIDDDAAFTAPDVVTQTLADLGEPRVGAVAIPHDDVNVAETGVFSQAPDAVGTWVVSAFVGTAYALRRDPFLELGGFREDFFHQGEEGELCLRMLEAGWVVRAGRSTPIDHYVSSRRDLTRMDVYGRRNELLTVWTAVPARWVVPYLMGYAVRGIRHGVSVGRVRNQLRGITMGLRAILRSPTQRRPVRQEVFSLHRRLRAEGPLPLSEVLAALPHRNEP